MIVASLLYILSLHLSFATWIWESWYPSCLCNKISWTLYFVSLIDAYANLGQQLCNNIHGNFLIVRLIIINILFIYSYLLIGPLILLTFVSLCEIALLTICLGFLIGIILNIRRRIQIHEIPDDLNVERTLRGSILTTKIIVF